jgi:rubrerythrin
MDILYSGSELVEIGIQVEKNGRDFYNTLSIQSKDKDVKEIFKYLKEQEENHIIVFNNILASVHRYEPAQAYPQEYFAYMNALASDHIFTKERQGEKIAKAVKSDIEAIGLGIGFEKDSILFYEGMKRIMHENDKLVVDKLIIEEQNHLKALHDLREKMGE